MRSSRESGRTQPSQQRRSPRTPLQLRTPSCDSCDSDAHHPPTRRASSKLADRRSDVRAPMTEARSASNGITCQKKRGDPRMGNMATQLRQAQDEIKKLQERLSAFEAANIKAEQHYLGGDQVQLADDDEVKMSKSATSPSPSPSIHLLNNSDISHDVDTPPIQLVDVIRSDGAAAADQELMNSGEKETDVFEVPLSLTLIPAPATVEQQVDSDRMKLGKEFPVPEKEEEERVQQVPPLKSVAGGSTAATNNEVLLQRHAMELEAKLAEEEVEKLVAESESLKKQAAAAEVDAASARRLKEETAAKMSGMGEELEEMRRKVGETEEALKEEMAAKAGMEEEMKRLRVQTEQWRKAADAAAEVLAGDGRRCGSMESKNLFGYAVSGMAGFAHHHPLVMDDLEEAGKKKGGGIRVLGYLWKKKQQHHH